MNGSDKYYFTSQYLISTCIQYIDIIVRPNCKNSKRMFARIVKL